MNTNTNNINNKDRKNDSKKKIIEKISVDENEDTNTDKIDDPFSNDIHEHVDGAVTIERPWYFEGGTRYPKPATFNKKSKKRNAKLFPSEDPLSDRITNQLMFVPPNYQELKKQKRYKTILLYNGLGAWNVKEGVYTVFCYLFIVFQHLFVLIHYYINIFFYSILTQVEMYSLIPSVL